MKTCKTNKSTVLWFSLFMAIGFISMWVFTSFVVKFMVVPTSSMAPTIPANTFIVVDRLAYRETGPERGDIVVVWSDELHKYLCKRVIGLPGETVKVTNGHVYINGSILNETYVSSEDEQDYGTFHVPENEYFLLGDNRKHSNDSRKWEEPFLLRENIVGQAQAKGE